MKKLIIFLLIAILLLTITAVIFTDVKLMVWAEEPEETITTEETIETVPEDVEILNAIHSEMIKTAETITAIQITLIFMICIHYVEKWFKIAKELNNKSGRIS